MDKKLEIYNVDSDRSKLTIAQDRVTIKVGRDYPTIDFSNFLNHCANITVPLTVRGGIRVEKVKETSVNPSVEITRISSYLRGEGRKVKISLNYLVEHDLFTIKRNDIK